MHDLDSWLAQRGLAFAIALEARGEPLCQVVADHLALVFSSASPSAADTGLSAADRDDLRAVIGRFHKLMLVLLIFQYPHVVAGELRDGLIYPSRRRLTYNERVALVRWYFAAIYQQIPLEPGDQAPLRELQAQILALIDAPTRAPTLGDAALIG